MNKALIQLTLTRFREFYREPAAVFWVYGFPLILAVALGIAFRDRPVEKISVDIVTDAVGGTDAALSLESSLRRDERYDIRLNDNTAARQRLRTAKTNLVIVPIADKPGYEFLHDPNRAECLLARNAADNTLLRAKSSDVIVPADKTIDEPGGRYIDFLLPGLIGLNLMGGGLFGVGFLIVDMRVRKLLKRFLATPMRKTDFLLAIMFSRLVFVLIEITFLLLFGWLAFGIRIQGNFAALIVLIVVGAMSFAGVGLLIASRAKTIETVSGLMNAFMLPMYVVSGVFFSSERFPDITQPFIKALPLTAINNGLRTVINDGGDFDAILVPVAILSAWGIASFGLALKLFRWK